MQGMEIWALVWREALVLFFKSSLPLRILILQLFDSLRFVSSTTQEVGSFLRMNPSLTLSCAGTSGVLYAIFLLKVASIIEQNPEWKGVPLLAKAIEVSELLV